MTTTQTTSPVPELRALSDLIRVSVDKIEALCIERGQTYPLLDQPFTPQSEASRMSPNVATEGSLIVSAAAQLIATVRSPVSSVAIQAVQYHASSCVRVAILLHVPEILRDAGAQGMHVKDIAAPTGVDAGKLARILRVLATRHIFKEVAPDTFANNRLSSVLDTGKSISDILADPDAKYDNTICPTALLEHALDGGLLSSYYLPDVLLDPKWAHSSEPNETPFNKAFNTTLPAFEWTALPENTQKRRLFANGMRSTQHLVSAMVVLDGFDWEHLPHGSVIVDVGGNTGSKMLPLAKTYDHFKFVVQDRPDVIGNATEFWNANIPGAISSGRVKIQAHDFFTLQPVQKPAVFYLCNIIHDWSDKYCVKILTQLRAAAGPETQLVIVDGIVPYSSAQSTLPKEIPGAMIPPPPEPLLPNLGEANITPYLSDMQMMVALNGSERTVMQYDDILEASGWRLARVSLDKGLQSTYSKVIGVPI
ncbi:O-methyltransferase [Irpex rosettiformis]|uniref:O-methyltransferase n=1 Tax=Irpex rosettiformis TaxID=378272 RepID=A0ACB8U0N2_9APHY|nr:O-methyltransferase [Irpex rosettiformis]